MPIAIYCDICKELLDLDEDGPVCDLCRQEEEDEEFDNWLNESE